MKRLLLLYVALPIFLGAQVPIAEFDFDTNIEDTYGNFPSEGNPIYNSEMSALEFSKDYEILIDPEKNLDIVGLTTQISFRTKSFEIPFFGQYAIEGLYYKAGDTGSANRSMSLYLFGASSPFDLFYVHSNAGQFEVLVIKDIISTDVLYNLHIVQTLDTVRIYNDCILLGKGAVNSHNIDYNKNDLRLGLVPSPAGNLVWERTFNGEIHSLRFYDQALTEEQIQRSCLTLSTFEDEYSVGRLDFSLFPNPSDDRVSIDVERLPNGTNLYLFDVFGRKIKSEKLQRSNESKNHLDWNTSDLPVGMYFVTADSKDNIKSIIN